MKIIKLTGQAVISWQKISTKEIFARKPFQRTGLKETAQEMTLNESLSIVRFP